MTTLRGARGITSDAVMRAANAMLHSLGGREVQLLFPLHELPGEIASELGLVDPGVEEVPVGPVIARNLATDNAGPRRRVEFLIPGSAIAEQLAAHDVKSARAFLESALGLAFEGELYRIEGMSEEQFAGTTYLYRVVGSY